MSEESIFTQAIKVEITSALSNIVKNAVEAIHSEKGKVVISLAQVTDTKAIISIEDNGCGIPEENIQKIFDKDISYKKGGTGLGLYQAKAAIEKLGGRIKIKSQIGVGTRVEILVPTKFKKQSLMILVDSETHLVFLDDEIFVHQAWKTKLPKQIPSEHIHFFSTAEKFLVWFEQNKTLNTYFFFDLELSKVSRENSVKPGNSVNGLYLIEKLDIKDRAILFTGRADDDKIQSQAAELSVRLFDKIKMDLIQFQWKPSEVSSSKTDAILIDDNKANRIAWEGSGRLNGLTVQTYESLDEFLPFSEKILRTTPIFVDYLFNREVKGPEIASLLFQIGFTQLYLTTGLPSEKVKIPVGIIGVIDKTFPSFLVSSKA